MVFPESVRPRRAWDVQLRRRLSQADFEATPHGFPLFRPQVRQSPADDRWVKSFVIIGRGWLVGLCCLLAWPVWAGTVTLDASTRSVELWPAVRMLSDPAHGLLAQQAIDRRADFVAPGGHYANLGPRADTLWLRIPLQLDVQAPRRWVLAVEYASIDRIEVFQPGADGVGGPVVLGRTLPFSQHPLPSLAHATMLEFEPGAQELLLRVRTRSSMVLPIVLSTPEAFIAAEARSQLLQGLMAGAMLCLLLYSLTQWVSLRESMFLNYAITIAGTGLFFVAYSGLGPQHLWGDQAWLNVHVAPLAVLVAIVGGCLFIEKVLDIQDIQPWVARALKLLSASAAAAAVAFAIDLIDYPTAQRLATLLGPLPMLAAIPVAWLRAYRGERVGVYMLIGWGAYATATVTMAALLRGWIDANFWTLNLFQFGAMFEMAMWMRVLGVRIEALRASAQRAHLERDALRSMAHTDALTGLPNRRGLSEVLQQALPRSSAERMTAVFLLDLDGFKPINDRLGHEAGDEVLVGVARRLQALLRGSDTVARLGGDEFVVIASGLAGDADAQALGRKLLDGFGEPFDAAGQSCRVGLTIGYALAPLDGADASSLLKRADAAMYAGKQAGRQCLIRGQASVGLAGA
jgi:diguanylate cyclase (GGDEF)-like protein